MDRHHAIRAIALVLVMYTMHVHSQITTPSPGECIDGPSTWYRGTRSETATGKTCQRWDTDKPHRPKHIPKDGGNHNYCRNPDNDLRGTWCYTVVNTTRWEYCNISKCPDDSLVIWTNYDAASESTHLLQVQADPEIVKKETDSKGSFNVSVLTGSNRSMTEYWALAADYQGKKLFFTDYRSEYVAEWEMDSKTAVKHFEGMAHGIECIAFDWKTNNLYWTDSEFKWIMVAEKSFQYYAPVYRTAPDPAYGLTVHSVKRLLIFSTYKALGSKILVTDLAGKNPKVLFSFPHVFDVTGITIDYTDDRIYWTDFTGYGGMVMSSLLDGTNKTQHHYRGGSIFWGVAPYLDYLYVTDVHARYSMTGSRFYSVWILTKHNKQVFRYTLSGKPRGIAVYSHNEEFSYDAPPSSGECDEALPCDHICLPRINATRVCACSLGYHLDSLSGKCQPKLVDDDYLLVADAGQGKVFQIPLTPSSSNNFTINYSIVPVAHKWKTVTVAVDQRLHYLYWSDKKNPSVGRSSFDGSRYLQIGSSYANSIVVDPQTGNLFYSDNEKDTIMVSIGSGSLSRTIVKPDPGKSNTTSIRMLTQDIKYKYIYWTDTFSKEGEGKVLRCRFDGSEKEVVLDQLNWPHAITIDYKTNRLYVAEAKNAIIYEIELKSLLSINNTSAKQKHYKQYDVSAYITRISPYIIDLKIHNGMAYVVDGKSSRLERFNLTEGAPSMAPYGPAEFFRVTTLSVYSKTFFTRYIEPYNDPCKHAHCREMCVALSDTDKSCMCRDGKRSVATICIDDDRENSDITPPTPQNCPDDISIGLPSCADTVTYAWEAPSWTDDKTSLVDIVITTPLMKSPASLFAGRHEFSYTAKDKSGNVGYCRFAVTVADNQCPPTPNARIGMRRTDSTCENRAGSVFNVTCISEGYVVWLVENGEYKTVPWYEVMCSKDLIWISRMAQNSDCRPALKPVTTTPKTTTSSTTTTTTAATTTTTTTTTPSTTTTTPSTTTTTPSTTTTPTKSTSSTTKEPSTTTTKGTTAIVTTTSTSTAAATTAKTTTAATTTSTATTTTAVPTTTAATTTTAAPTTKTTVAATTTITPSISSTPTSPNEGSPDTKSPTPGQRPQSNSPASKPNTTTALLNDTSSAEKNAGSNKLQDAAKTTAGLSAGVTAAIVVLVIVFIVVIAVVVFVTIRNRPAWAVTKLSFPVFWKSGGDDSVKMESSSNAYQIMT